MKDIKALIIDTFSAGALFLLVPFFGIIYGSGAWIMGLFFGDTIAITIMQLFNTDVDIREIGYFNVGLTLGFLGGYIRSTLSNNTTNNCLHNPKNGI